MEFDFDVSELPLFISYDEIAEWFGFSEATIKKYRHRKWGPRCVQFSDGTLRFYREDIYDWFDGLGDGIRRGRVQTLNVIDCKANVAALERPRKKRGKKPTQCRKTKRLPRHKPKK